MSVRVRRAGLALAATAVAVAALPAPAHAQAGYVCQDIDYNHVQQTLRGSGCGIHPQSTAAEGRGTVYFVLGKRTYDCTDIRRATVYREISASGCTQT